MSTVSIQNPAADHQDPGRSAPPAGVVISWLAILAVILFVSVRVWKHARTESAGRAADEIALNMAARYTVGFHQVLARGDDAQARTNTGQAAVGFISGAHAPADQLRAVAVLGELEGGPAALDQLDSIGWMLRSPPLSLDADSFRTIYTRGPAALGADRCQQLIDRHGWFARLALSYGKSPGDPSRRHVIAESLRAFWAAVGLFVLIAGYVIAGSILFALALARKIDRQLITVYRRPASPTGAFLEAFALYLVGYVVIGWAFSRFSHAPIGVAYALDLLWVAFACAWPMIRGVSWPELQQGFGWTAGRGMVREAGAGIVGYLAAVPLLGLAIALTSLLGKLTGERAVHPIVFGAGTGLKTILGLYLLASVWAPLVEETMFRGALFHHLRFRHRWIFAAALSALMFAALHPQGWTAIPVLGTIGFAFAGIREWRGTAIASAAAHALNNAVATTILILTLG